MAKKTPPYLLFLCFSFTFSSFPCSYNCKTIEQNQNSMIKGMFVFGSSLVDNGNNNFLNNSMAKADYLPYGIDFPFGPSGRFTNGKNVIDLLGEQLKLPTYIPAFTDPSTKGRKIFHGVNYASGASGILDTTGLLAGNVISLSQQIRNFEEVTLPELEAQLGRSTSNSRDSLAQYLFVVGTGGNDYSFNYFLSKPNNTVSLEAFTANLTSILSYQLKRLYNKGARKFVLLSVNPNGCSPMVMARQQPFRKGCMQYVNKAVRLFNSNLKSLVDIIRTEMPGSNLVFVNSYKLIRDIIRNPASKGFGDASNPCCEVALVNEGGTGILCKKGGSTCADRSKQVFFDGLHPTEAVNVVLAAKAYSSVLKTEVYPFNVKQLTAI